MGEVMTSDEKEVDEKLYRVVRKKGSHVNRKVNPDGTLRYSLPMIIMI